MRNEMKIKIILVVESWNPNMAPHLDGSIQRPRKWLRLTIENVDQYIFRGSVNEILYNIEQHLVQGDYDNNKNHYLG